MYSHSLHAFGKAIDSQIDSLVSKLEETFNQHNQLVTTHPIFVYLQWSTQLTFRRHLLRKILSTMVIYTNQAINNNSYNNSRYYNLLRHAKSLPNSIELTAKEVEPTGTTTTINLFPSSSIGGSIRKPSHRAWKAFLLAILNILWVHLYPISYQNQYDISMTTFRCFMKDHVDNEGQDDNDHRELLTPLATTTTDQSDCWARALLFRNRLALSMQFIDRRQQKPLMLVESTALLLGISRSFQGSNLSKESKRFFIITKLMLQIGQPAESRFHEQQQERQEEDDDDVLDDNESEERFIAVSTDSTTNEHSSSSSHHGHQLLLVNHHHHHHHPVGRREPKRQRQQQEDNDVMTSLIPYHMVDSSRQQQQQLVVKECFTDLPSACQWMESLARQSNSIITWEIRAYHNPVVAVPPPSYGMMVDDHDHHDHPSSSSIPYHDQYDQQQHHHHQQQNEESSRHGTCNMMMMQSMRDDDQSEPSLEQDLEDFLL